MQYSRLADSREFVVCKLLQMFSWQIYFSGSTTRLPASSTPFVTASHWSRGAQEKKMKRGYIWQMANKSGR
jgi:hypothetical protein